MLHVKTTLKPSHVSGIGLFANENIVKGITIWTFQKNFDIRFSREQLMLLPLQAQEQFRVYAYLSKKTHLYIYPADNGRFINHSPTPNIIVVFNDSSEEDINIASRDIVCDEELTINYQDFDSEFENYKNSYRNTNQYKRLGFVLGRLGV